MGTTNASHVKGPVDENKISLSVAATTAAGQEDQMIDGSADTVRVGRTYWTFLIPTGGLHLVFGGRTTTVRAATTSDPLIPAGPLPVEMSESCAKFSALSPAGTVDLERWPG